ncbi:MAG: protein-tyrosine-phosphatase [Saprospiraceae bacterium]|nr:protein-tyrosine-phosphatase [Saprospiraceae bacterium]
MYHHIRKNIKSYTEGFNQISPERKELLEKLGQYIQQKYETNRDINLVFICTHNSRRSHFGQIAAAIAAEYYSIDKVNVFSGGTEATAFNPNAINALQELGFELDTEDKDSKNPIWNVQFGSHSATTCFSKVYDHPANPASNFAAIMTCSDAEQNCPYVPGTDIRIGITYEDPKKSDGTPEQQNTYIERFRQITTEMLYAFSLVE